MSDEHATRTFGHAHELTHELAVAAGELAHLLEDALQLPEPPRGFWSRPGVSPRAERWLEVCSSVVLAALTIGWTWSIVDARSLPGTRASAGTEAASTQVTASVTAALMNADAPQTAYLAGAALEALLPLRGASGKVRVVMRAPGESIATALPAGTSATLATNDSAPPAAPRRPGIFQLALHVADAIKPVADLNLIALTPLAARKNGRIGLYYIGRWPTEGKSVANRATARGNYTAPSGLIEVTPENEDTHLSDHFTLRDFLTHDQQSIWPKYVVVQTRLVDKLELVLADLTAHGISSAGIHVMSGFRTPQYNAGGGDPAGRASLSRHMYGDAADIWIDDDHDGRMDDLNHDGRVDVHDSEVIRAAVDRVEQAHPELVGGCGVYAGNRAHGPFTHIDARGYRARWLGTGDG